MQTLAITFWHDCYKLADSNTNKHNFSVVCGTLELPYIDCRQSACVDPVDYCSFRRQFGLFM